MTVVTNENAGSFKCSVWIFYLFLIRNIYIYALCFGNQFTVYQIHDCAAIMQCSINQATRIPNYNADKSAQCINKKVSVACPAVGRGTYLINALIGCISGK